MKRRKQLSWFSGFSLFWFGEYEMMERGKLRRKVTSQRICWIACYNVENIRSFYFSLFKKRNFSYELLEWKRNCEHNLVKVSMRRSGKMRKFTRIYCIGESLCSWLQTFILQCVLTRHRLIGVIEL